MVWNIVPVGSIPANNNKSIISFRLISLHSPHRFLLSHIVPFVQFISICLTSFLSFHLLSHFVSFHPTSFFFVPLRFHSSHSSTSFSFVSLYFFKLRSLLSHIISFCSNSSHIVPFRPNSSHIIFILFLLISFAPHRFLSF